MNKIDPRKGIVIKNHRKFINFVEKNNNKSYSQNKFIEQNNDISSSFNMDLFSNILSKMGEEIFLNIKNLLDKNLNFNYDLNEKQKNLSLDNVNKQSSIEIDIDNSLIDVGIGNSPELEKGKKSGKQLSVSYISKDTGLDSIKNKLRNLKNKI